MLLCSSIVIALPFFTHHARVVFNCLIQNIRQHNATQSSTATQHTHPTPTLAHTHKTSTNTRYIQQYSCLLLPLCCYRCSSSSQSTIASDNHSHSVALLHRNTDRSFEFL